MWKCVFAYDQIDVEEFASDPVLVQLVSLGTGLWSRILAPH
jgi:hypothetical protein